MIERLHLLCCPISFAEKELFNKRRVDSPTGERSLAFTFDMVRQAIPMYQTEERESHARSAKTDPFS